MTIITIKNYIDAWLLIKHWCVCVSDMIEVGVNFAIAAGSERYFSGVQTPCTGLVKLLLEMWTHVTWYGHEADLSHKFVGCRHDLTKSKSLDTNDSKLLLVLSFSIRKLLIPYVKPKDERVCYLKSREQINYLREATKFPANDHSNNFRIHNSIQIKFHEINTHFRKHSQFV